MFSFVVLIIEFLFFIIFKNNTEDNVIPVCFIFLYSIIYLIELLSKKKYGKNSYILAIGYILRIGILFFDVYFKDLYVLPNSGSDSEVFYGRALVYSLNIDSINTLSFSTIMGYLFYLIGPSRIFSQFVLTLFGVATLHVLFDITTLLELKNKYKKIIMILSSFMPNFIIISSLFLRESIPTFFITCSLLFFLKWFNNDSKKFLLFSFIFVLCACVFHSGCIAIMLGYIIVLFFYNNKKKVFSISFDRTFIGVIFLILLFYLYMNYGSVFFDKMVFANTLDDIAKTVSSGGSSYAQYVGNSDNIFNFILYSPLRMLYFTFSPFVWQWRGINDVIAFLFDSLVAIYTVFIAIKSLKYRGKYYKLSICLLIVWLSFIFVFGWGTSNTGTAIRHRDKGLIIELLLLICSFYNIKERKMYLK